MDANSSFKSDHMYIVTTKSGNTFKGMFSSNDSTWFGIMQKGSPYTIKWSEIASVVDDGDRVANPNNPKTSPYKGGV